MCFNYKIVLFKCELVLIVIVFYVIISRVENYIICLKLIIFEYVMYVNRELLIKLVVKE